jgi:hypothetical protein
MDWTPAFLKKDAHDIASCFAQRRQSDDKGMPSLNHQAAVTEFGGLLFATTPFLRLEA